MHDDIQIQKANLYDTSDILFDPGPPRMFAPNNTHTYAIVLGSGKPEPSPYRYGPGGAVIVHNKPYIIDAGEGIWRAIAKAAIAHNKTFSEAFSPDRIQNLFITHLHSDHTVGIASLLLLPWTCGKEKPLHVYGPKGTQHLVDMTLEAHKADIEERVHGPEQKEPLGCKAIVHEIEDSGVIYTDEHLTIEAFNHPHGGFAQNFGYAFTTAERKILWAGDGIEGDTYIQAMKDADLLFTDVASEQARTVDTPWRKRKTSDDISDLFHIRSNILGTLAEQAQVNTIVLHHEQNYNEPFSYDSMVKEVKKYFSGDVVSARDSDVF